MIEAASSGSLEAVKELLAYHTEIPRQNEDIPSNKAEGSSLKVNDTSREQTLPQEVSFSRNSTGVTSAAISAKRAVLDVNAREDTNCNSALHEAIVNGKCDVFSELVKDPRVEMSAKNRHGKTVYDLLSVAQGDVSRFRSILQKALCSP